MKKSLLSSVVLVLCSLFAFAGEGNTKKLCTPTVSTGTVAPTTICAGTAISVPYTFTDCVDPGNVFTAQLSDALGSFATPTNIGSASSVTSGILSAIIPGATVFGTGYRIRVIASSPVTIGTDNGVDLVLLPKPNANYSINNAAQCVNANNYSFTNSSTGSITGYVWRMGDGNETTNTNPNYSYASAGNFNVQLVAIGTNGCRDSLTQIVSLLPKPTPNFIAVNPSACTTPNFSFSNTSSISVGSMTYAWTFGDGNTSTATNPSNAYAIAGTYTVKLIATSNNNCKDSISKSVTILDIPVAAYLINDTSQCLSNNNFTFSNFSTGVGNTYSWDFADGSTSSSTNPNKVYTTAGTYSVKLIVTNVNGCKDSVSKTVIVTSNPKAGFAVVGNTLCSSGLNVQFSNTSTGSSNTYSWNFGDNSTSSATNPTKTYAAATTYFVKLIATDAGGCVDSITQSVAVNIKPTANFNINNSTQCSNNNLFVFSNTTTGSFDSSFWTFGDGITSTLLNPSKAYNISNNYSVKLVVKNSNGCLDSISKSITVNPAPVPDFSVNGNTGCSGTLAVSFNNNSTGSGNTYNWLFGDGNSSTSTNPSNTYPATGSYIIRLVATNVFGCKDSTERSITFATKPTADFSINKDTQCLSGNSFTFNNLSVGAATYNWSFGDGIISSLTNPSKSYNVAGNYTVRLIVTNVGGCKDSLSKSIVVSAAPTASFSFSGATNCTNNLTLAFANTSANAISYVWSFGDGNTSTAINPTYTYASAGTYTVKLFATNSNGCKDSITQTITFSTNPTAAYSINNATQCINNNLFAFTNNSIGGATYLWSFGDGSTSSATSPVKSYATAGNYSVKLIVTNISGCKDSTTQNVTVSTAPVAAFSFTGATNCTTNLTLAFTNTSTNATSYVWSFGDGNTSTSTAPNYSYVVSGSYTIKLVATNANGCKDSTSQAVTFNSSPTVAYSINSLVQCLDVNIFTFNNTSVGGATYLWSFGDGFTSTATSPTKSYTVAGIYAVKLVVTNANGCKDSLTQTVTVRTKPTAAFTFSGATNCTTNLTIAFNNNSVGAVSYMWSFGDGNTSTLAAPTYTYASSGTYTVKLVATNASGCKDSISQTVTFTTNPTAAFSINNSTQCLNGNSFVLSNNSVGGATYLWSFGDGSISTSANPTYNYVNAGNYTIKLITTNATGCKDSTTQTVTVTAKPTAAFTFSGATNCTTNLTIAFNNNSVGAVSYAWNFGDGNTSTLAAPTYTYASSGTYTVKLVATNASGCKDSISQTVTFTTNPTAAFNINNSTQCLNGNSFVLSNNSVGGATYLWSFGDGSISTSANPTYNYVSAGNYTIKLITTNATGCKDSTTQTVTVTAKPTAAFTFSGATNCTTNLTIVFNNNSVGAVSYAWSFGDGNTSTLAAPTYTYASSGTYTVKLVATNANGCKDSISQTVTFTTKPTAGINIPVGQNANQCRNNNSYTFTDASIGAVTYSWIYGDGFTSSAQNPVAHSYTAAGTYIIKHIATNAGGCTDTATTTVIVSHSPIATFVSNYASCNNLTAVFTQSNTSNTAFSAWYFGDGNVVTGITTASHSYPSAASYTIKYIAYDNSFFCADSSTQTITFSSNPSSAFTVNTTTQCINNQPFNFTNTSVGAVSYVWNFGDGNTSTATNPAKTYTSAGIYTVKLIVTNANGCKDSSSTSVTVLSRPVAAFTFSGSGNCTNNLTLGFNNTSIGGASYLWSFGDGNTSTLTAPTHIYASAGTYSVKLVVTNASGCKDSISQTITITTKPTAAFSINNSTQCLSGNSFVFTNNSVNATTYSWSYGDLTTSTSTSPSHTYSNAGTYTVRLIATNANGCTDTTTQTVTVITKPTAAFTFSGATNCTNNLSIAFNNNASNGTNYLWSFGDGTTSALFAPTHTYAATGTYTVKLVVLNLSGCSDSISQTVTFNTKPIAAFAANANIQCITNNSFVFTNSSAGASSYNWNFGDGGVSSIANPTKVYATPGVYKVLLTANSGVGCTDTISKTVTVLAQPVALFATNNPNGCSIDKSISFVNQSVNATTYNWSFGDASTSSQTNPLHTYSTFGSYTITLTAASNNGCSSTTTQTITIQPKPTAAFSINNSTQCLNGNSFVFTNNSVGGVYHYWVFGDGSISTSTNPTYNYSTAGNYTVKLFTTNTNGCKDSAIQTLAVSDKPTANFTYSGSSSCTNNLTLTFNSTAINATSYLWSFGDGNTSTIAAPTYTYASVGVYTVKLLTTNASGCKDSTSQNITFTNKPVAAFSVNNTSQCLVGNSFVFTNNSVGGVYHYWVLGDGNVTISANATYSYGVAGNYTVKLITTNASGCKDSASQTITVLNKPIAAFSLVNFNGCSNNFTVNFNNSSTGATSYNWNFGDATGSTLTSPTKTYASQGIYTIGLTALGANGCFDTATKVITLTQKPTAAFSVNNTMQCLVGNSFNFSNSSVVATSYMWNFGDGTTSNLQNPTKVYNTAGSYKVLLTAINNAGCTDTISATVIVMAKPAAAFNLVNFNGCTNNFTVNFNNTSIGATIYNWNFGDATGSNATSPTKTYTGAGSYKILLTAINSNGCFDTISTTINLTQKPTAAFSTNNNTQCLVGNSFSFANSSVAATSYTWNLGDGTTSNLQNPTKIYNAAGSYKVLLTATNNVGCTDTISTTVTVTPAIQASFSLSNFNACSVGSAITINNTSTGANGATSFWNFGDGTTSNAFNPTKTYNAVGSYTITYTVTNGNCSSTASQTITYSTSPVAAFTVAAASQCANTNSFSFTNSSTGAQLYSWNFGDGTTSSLSNPTKHFNTVGNYTVTLTATNSVGCSNSATTTVLVVALPTLSFNLNNPSQCINGNSFTVTNTSPLQSGVSYYFSFGDTYGTTNSTATKIYSNPGVYKISLFATNTAGCTDSVSKTVTVLAKPNVSFNNSSNKVCVGNSISFINTSTNTTNTNYLWNFGNGTTSTLANNTVAYAVAGTYVVRLYADNGLGCGDSATQTIVVADKPIPSFTVTNNNVCEGTNAIVRFRNTSTGSVGSYYWLFDDGSVYTDSTPVKIYNATGTHIVKLFVSSVGGCKDSISQTVNILPRPKASFSLSSVVQCVNNNTFNFVNTTASTSGVVFNVWDLGDGSSSTASAVTKSYALAGTYTVKLVVTNSGGCADSVTQTVNVLPQPTAVLTGSGVICEGNSFIMNVAFTGTAPYSFIYTDGTNNYTVSNILTKVYGLGVSPTTTTIYRIIAMNDAFCNASTAQVATNFSTVTVNNISFTQQPQTIVGCIGNKALLKASIVTNSTYAYQWQKNGVNITGANTDSLSLPNLSLLDAGIYRLAILLPCGIVYSSNAVVTVSPVAPPPAFAATTTYCQFDTAKQLMANGNILKWYSVPTGGLYSSVGPTPYTDRPDQQTYWVSNTNAAGCESPRYPVVINVLPAPTIKITVTGRPEILPGQSVTLKATSSPNALGIRWYRNGTNIGSVPNNQLVLGFNNLGKYVAEAVTAAGCRAVSDTVNVRPIPGLQIAADGNNLYLYPNPAVNNVNLVFDNPVNENAFIRIVDASGHVMASRYYRFTKRFEIVPMSVVGFRPDMYVVEVLNSKGISVARNVLIKATN